MRLGYWHYRHRWDHLILRPQGLVHSRENYPGCLNENGWAYDRAVLDIRGRVRLVVPQDARVEQGAADGRAEVFMEKVFASYQVQPERMSVRGARAFMGCAWKEEGARVVLATYGEYNFWEGGSYMRLLVRVPAGLPVTGRPGLTAYNSPAQRWPETQPHDENWSEGFWYWPCSVAPGWHALPSMPDPAFTLRPDREP
jgi:hypothetical protein